MKKHRLAFVDLETTGLNPIQHEIIDIGIIIAEQREDLFGIRSLHYISEHEIYLIPQHIETADPKGLQVNKYAKRDWSNAVPQKEGLMEAVRILEGTIFVAQNVSFDWTFLCVSGNTYDVNFDKAVYYHKLDLASMAFGKLYHDSALSRFTLRELTVHFGVINHDAHTAIADARATFEVAKKLLELPQLPA